MCLRQTKYRLRNEERRKNTDVTTHTAPEAFLWQRCLKKNSMILLLKNTGKLMEIKNNHAGINISSLATSQLSV
jgi:hypothetical protein